MERHFQPSLLWVKATDWLQGQFPEREFKPSELQLYIYRTDKGGAYQMTGPKLYWTEEPMGGPHIVNCDQDSLEKNVDKLGEVVLYDRKYRKTYLLGKNYKEAWEKISE